MEESIGEVWGLVVGLVTSYGLSVIGAVVILIVGFVVAGWVRGAVNKTLSKVDKVDATLRGFFSSLAYYAVVIFTIIAVLAQFGVETTSFIAVIGAAGLAIGLALQGTLSNVAAGVMLLLFRPFKIGDYIEGGGLAGTVKNSAFSSPSWRRRTTCRSSRRIPSSGVLPSRTIPSIRRGGSMLSSASLTRTTSTRPWPRSSMN